jgi:integrase/recombinase XerC
MKYLLEPEQRQLLKTLRDSNSALRDYMIIELVLHTGVRIQELKLPNVSDIFNGMTVRSHLTIRAETAKRCKEREIFLNTYIRKRLKHYIAWKKTRSEPTQPLSPLFISKKKGRIGQRTLQDTAERWFMRAGLTAANGLHKYTFHSLRHTLAMNLRRRGVNLERIQKLLGHASLQATGIYLEPSREDLIEAVESLSV